MQITLTHLSHRPTIDIQPRVFKNLLKLQVLGRGGFGTVYKFTHARKKYDVALKHIYTLDSKDVAKKMMTLRQEIFLHSQLTHRNIVHFLGQHEGEEGLFIVLEYVDGWSLHGFLEAYYHNRSPRDMEEPVIAYELIFRYTRYVLKGLDYLHKKRIVHSDLRCANILLSTNHVAKLADFGISTQLGDIANLSGFRRPGAVLKVGNPFWCAPEVLLGGEADYSSDVWSLGICLMEMLFFQLPFASGFGGYEVATQYIWRLCQDRMIPEVPDWVDEDVRNTIVACLNFNPDERPKPKELLNTIKELEIEFEDEDDDDEDSEDDDDEDEDDDDVVDGGERICPADFDSDEMMEDLWSEQINHLWNEKVKRIKKKLLRRSIKYFPLKNLVGALDDSYGLATLYLGQALRFNAQEMDLIRYHPTQPRYKAGYFLHKLSIEDFTVSELRTALQHVCNEEAVKKLNETQEQYRNRKVECDKLSDFTVGDLMTLSHPLACSQRDRDWHAVARHMDKKRPHFRNISSQQRQNIRGPKRP